MCGRYSIYETNEALEERFGARFGDNDQYRQLYNAAPMEQLPIIRNDRPKDIMLATWSFLPEWAHTLRPQINARGETVATTPLFRDASAHRRCLVLVNGFYEWQQNGSSKTPYYITLTSGAPFACAGIWEPSNGRTRGASRFAILTIAANPLVSTIHDRMPVILDKRDEQQWLNGTSRDALASLIAPFDPSLMTMHPVSVQMNSSRFESPEAIVPVEN